MQVDEKSREIKELNQLRERQKKQLVDDYERRIQNLKKQMTMGSKDKQLMIELEFQNEQLKKKMNILQASLVKINSEM